MKDKQIKIIKVFNKLSNKEGIEGICNKNFCNPNRFRKVNIEKYGEPCRICLKLTIKYKEKNIE